MKKLFLVILLLIPLNISAQEKDIYIQQIVETHELINPGLYEVISKQTGSIIYLYKDRSGQVAIEVVPSGLQDSETKASVIRRK
jgi:hypothetical protein